MSEERAAEAPEPAPGEAAAAAPVEEELLRARKELAALQDRALRLQAEFENYRRRQQREREDYHRQAKERILRELLPVLDNLERAVRAGGAEVSAETLREGVDLVQRQFAEALAQLGVEPIAAVGSLFDPHLHEAMSRVETGGDPPDGTVVEEYRRGYLLQGRVLRPALVGVAKAAEEGEAEEAGGA